MTLVLITFTLFRLISELMANANRLEQLPALVLGLSMFAGGLMMRPTRERKSR